MPRKTKIFCTVGPVSDNADMLGKMMDEGMDVCRLNFSHEDHSAHADRIALIRSVAASKNREIAILLDTKGPEIRTGVFENGFADFHRGDMVEVWRNETLGNRERFHISCPELFDDVRVGHYLLIDDGKMRLTIVDRSEDVLVCRVENSGIIKTRKGVNVPNVILSMPFLSEKDISDIRFGCKHGIDYIAASFVRRADDVIAIRNILKEEGKESIQVISKIENQEGYDNIDEILKYSDGIMVARGDLGVEVSLQLVPIYQKQMIQKANAAGKPVVTATHMLESMMHNPRPTRAEASDVANAVLDGSDAIMLSGESAVGEYPLEAIRTMAIIATAIEEQVFPYEERLLKAIASAERTRKDALGMSIAETTLNLNIAAIVAFTESGSTARRISKFRPKAPVIAVATSVDTMRKLAANWGVATQLDEKPLMLEEMDERANKAARDFGIQPGQTIIIAAGIPGGAGNTNMMRIIDVV